MGVRVVFPDMGKDPSIQLIEKTITENGTYDAITDGANGYSKVNVNVEGGSVTWATVFDGDVTTAFAPGGSVGTISDNMPIEQNTIKVTFNGVNYECQKVYFGADENYFFGGVTQEGIPNFSDYPFCIRIKPNNRAELLTETAGTYSLKIEEPQSGGGGDFSTATVTFINQKSTYPEFFGSFVIDDEDYSGTFYVANPTANATTVYTVALYKGKASISNPNNEPLDISGSAEEYNEEVIITGDCTIEIIDMA